MKKIDVKLLRTIRKTWGQFVAVAAVVAVGLTAYIGMQMGILNLEHNVNTYKAITHKADLQVQLLRISEVQLDQLGGIPGVKGYDGRIVVDTYLQAESDDKVKLRLISVQNDSGYNRPYMVKGRPIKDPSREVLVIEPFAKARGLEVGDILTFSANGAQKEMVICGVAISSEYIYLIEDEQTLMPDFARFGILFVDEDYLQHLYGYQGSFNEVLVAIDAPTQLRKVKDRLEVILDFAGVKRIDDKDSLISDRMVEEEIEQGKKMVKTIPVIFLTVAAGIMIIMLSRTVKSDRLSIGILKAIGYSDLQVLRHYSGYAIGVGLAGGAFGVLFGVLLANEVTAMYGELVFSLPILGNQLFPQYLLLAVGLCAVFSVISGVAGASGVLRIAPSEAMRPDAPKRGKRIWIERWPWLWKRLSFSWKLVMRSLFRNKRRLAFLVVGIAVTYAVTVIPLFMIDEFYAMFNDQYGGFYRFDYSINFARPVTEDVIYDVKALVKTRIVEPVVEVPFQLINGWRKRTMNIVGLESDTQLYRLKDLEGNAITLGPGQFYVSENLARVLAVAKGDKIVVDSYLPGRENVTLTVSGIVSQKLGSNAYMQRTTMNRLLLEEGLVTSVVLTSRDGVKNVFADHKNVASVQSILEMKNIFMQFVDMTVYSLVVMLGCAFVLGFAILYNSAIMSIHERTLEFSALRVMGFDKLAIFGLVAKENIITALLGILLGLPLAQWIAEMFKETYSNEMYTFGTQISSKATLFSMVTVLLFALVALFATYEKIQKLNFIDALKARVT